MLLSLRKNGRTSLFKEVRVFKAGLPMEGGNDEENADECPQEQIMSVRQTSPGKGSEGDIFFAKSDLTLTQMLFVKPTLQAALWLSELIATTTLTRPSELQKPFSGHCCSKLVLLIWSSKFGSNQKGPAEQVAPRVSSPQNLQILSVRFPYHSLEKM